MLGLETVVEIGVQASAAEPATQARQALNVYSITGGRTRGLPDDPILNGGFQNLSDPTLPGPGLPDHRIRVSVPLCEAQFPFWCRAFFGAPVTTGLAPNHIHTFRSGVAALPYVLIQHQRQASDFSRHWSCVGEELSIDLSSEREGFAMAEISFVGIDETIAASTLAGTVTAAPTLVRNPQANVNAIYNGVSGGQVMGGKITFKRNLKRVYAADGSAHPVAIEYQGKSTLEGELNCRYANQTMLADARARTERAITMELLTNANRGLRFLMGQALLAETPVDISGPDGVEFAIPIKGHQSASVAALQAVALSGSASITL